MSSFAEVKEIALTDDLHFPESDSKVTLPFVLRDRPRVDGKSLNNHCLRSVTLVVRDLGMTVA